MLHVGHLRQHVSGILDGLAPLVADRPRWNFTTWQDHAILKYFLFKISFKKDNG